MFNFVLHLGPLTISAYGLFLFFALFLGTFLVWREALREGYIEEKVFDTVIVTLLASIVGARVFQLLLIGPFSMQRLLAWDGGGYFYGALLVGFIAFYMQCKQRGWSPFEMGDAATPGVVLGLALEKAACLATGCSFTPNLVALVLFCVLFIALMQLERIGEKTRLFPGFRFYVFFFGVSVTVLVTEYLTAQPRGLTVALSIAFLAFSVLGFRIRKRSYLAGTVRSEIQKRGRDVQATRLVARTWKEHYMEMKLNSSFLDKLRSRLLRQEAKLRQEQQLLEQEDPFSKPGRANDNAEYLDDTAEQVEGERFMFLKSRIRSSLENVQVALRKLNRGKYGICENCGRKIDPERLQAYPEVRLCLACEKKRERKEEKNENLETSDRIERIG